MKKQIWIPILIVVVVVIGVLIFSSQKSAPIQPIEKEVIKIGFISALSGDAGVWGQSLKKGFDFAVEEINSNGGVDGKKIQAIYEDDGCDATTGVNAFNKVINIDKAKIITGSVCSSVAMSVAKMTQENRVFYIASGATNPDVPKQGDLIFRLWPSDSYEAKEIGRYAVKDLGLTNFSILYFNDNPAGIALRDSFKESIETNGGKVISEERVLSSEKDFRTPITKLIKENPEGLYIAAIPEQTPLAVNKAKELGYKGIILLYGPSVLSEGIPEKISIKEKIYYPSPLTVKETSFWEDYLQKTGTEADLLVSLGYDSVKLIEYGLNICGEDNDCIRDKILNLKNYQTSRGKISFDKDGDVEGIKYEIKGL